MNHFIYFLNPVLRKENEEKKHHVSHLKYCERKNKQKTKKFYRDIILERCFLNGSRINKTEFDLR